MKRLFIVWLLLGSLLNSYILFTQDVKASESLSGNPPQKKFLNPNRIRYDGSCMTIDGKDVFIYSAAFHYFRCPEELWRDRFVTLRRPVLIRSRRMYLGTGMNVLCRQVLKTIPILILLISSVG